MTGLVRREPLDSGPHGRSVPGMQFPLWLKLVGLAPVALVVGSIATSSGPPCDAYDGARHSACVAHHERLEALNDRCNVDSRLGDEQQVCPPDVRRAIDAEMATYERSAALPR
jgi:hypothetical protein